MYKQKRSLTVSGGIVLAVAVLVGASMGCKMSGDGTTGNSGAGDTKGGKGISATQICQTLAQPSFESRQEYNGSACSGSTYFGASDTRQGPSDTDTRPSYSYSVLGEQDVVNRVNLNMSGRADGAQFFATQADAVAKKINGQPLPKEIETAITAPLSTSGGDFTTSSKIGDVKVDLVRSSTNSGFKLTFQF